MGYLAVRCAVRAPIPNCEGFTRPISINAPIGTIVKPVEPAACASRGLIAYRMLDAMFGALAKAAPERIPAAWRADHLHRNFLAPMKESVMSGEAVCWDAGVATIP
ncbi:MAG: hypothetical protein CM1200mP41_38540 [Gammaproteobacteria bacterium]|nr:MAG: hypothetical protein CM1200mP41_38540 [Gammaproteobacteria bacterium]